MKKDGLLGYTFQDRPRFLAAARWAMREHLKMGKFPTRQTADSQERAIKALEAAEPPLTRCIGSWGAFSLLSRALANSKLEGGDNKDPTAEAVQGQVHGAVSSGLTSGADVPLDGGGGGGACASCCGRGLCGPKGISHAQQPVPKKMWERRNWSSSSQSPSDDRYGSSGGTPKKRGCECEKRRNARGWRDTGEALRPFSSSSIAVATMIQLINTVHSN